MKQRRTIGIRALKNDLSRVVEEVVERGDEYVVTNRDKPVAVLRPWREEDSRNERSARADEIIERIERLAREVAEAAGPDAPDAATIVSEQRR